MEANVHFVEKASNSPNVHQARPIEKLWGILAQEVYEGGWQASTQQELISRIQSQLKKTDSDNDLVERVKAKLRVIVDSGVLATDQKIKFNLKDNEIVK